MKSVERPSINGILKSRGSKYDNSSDVVAGEADRYLNYFDANEDTEKTKQSRIENLEDMTNTYYDLATDFYEYGWGEAFHFATLRKGESREHSFAKYEYSLALRLGMKPGDYVLDAGCGIGGPTRHIASFTGAKIVGLNCNDYQIQRARKLTAIQNLDHFCTFVKGDYHDISYPENTFDKAYAIESTCHSDNLVRVYSEIYRVLKPGGLFGCCEWIMTDKYDPNDKYHRKLKQDILEGDGLADIPQVPEVMAAAKKVGFEVIDARDHALESQVPWYSVLLPQWTLSDIKITPIGRWITHIALMCLETIKLAPQGSTKVHTMLCKGADGLAAAGAEGIFSPMYDLILKKPEK